VNVPTPDDVLAAVKTRLEAEPGWTALVAGGTWFMRRPEQAAFPYCVLTVEESPEPAYVRSDGGYLQDFAVEASVWVKSGDAAAADTAAPAALLQAALGWVAGDPANGVSVSGAVATTHVKPAGGALKLTDELRAGQDVLAAGRKVAVRVQGKRG
jgi:hypothetical protein